MLKKSTPSFTLLEKTKNITRFCLDAHTTQAESIMGIMLLILSHKNINSKSNSVGIDFEILSLLSLPKNYILF